MSYYGGHVSEVFDLRDSRGAIVAAGTWTGGKWEPGTELVANVYRNRQKVGEYPVVGVDRISCPDDFANAILLPVGSDILSGDVFSFNDAIPHHYNLRKPQDISIPQGVIKVHEPASTGIINADGVLLFHPANAQLPLTFEIACRQGMNEFLIPLRFPASDVPFFGIHAKDDSIPMSTLVNAVTPARRFILDAGQDQLNEERKGRRRPSIVYEIFEPRVAAKAASFQLDVWPAKLEQSRLVEHPPPTEPLTIFVEALRLVQENREQDLLLMLGERLINVDESLQNLKRFVRATIKKTKFEVTSPHLQKPIEIRQHMVDVIESVASKLETRTESREGEIYAVELESRWVRLVVKSNDRIELWTLNYDESHRNRVEGRIVPRTVKVSFTTATDRKARRGRGQIIELEDLDHTDNQ